MQYEDNCVYYTAHILDALFFFFWGFYGFNVWSVGGFVPLLMVIVGFCFLAMSIFALIQVFTKNSSAATRKANYVKFRFFAIIGLVIAGILFCILWIVWGMGKNVQSSVYINYAISSLIPFVVDAALLHSYHKTFERL